MNETYIKLFRKLRSHPIMGDPTALQIFIWILISVDYKNGSMVSGRYWASEELKIKPRTFHKALTERLRDRYDLVTLSSDNKNTTISVKNWYKYQLASDTTSDSPVTPKGQQSDTNQEYKNIRNNTYRHISCLSNTKLHEEIANQYHVGVGIVKSLSEEMVLYCQSRGKKYSNYKAALQNWLRRRITEKPSLVIVKHAPITETLTKEQRQINIARIKQLKDNLLRL